jgi:hypothetical protein
LDKPSNTLLDRIAVLEKRAADADAQFAALHPQQAEDRNAAIKQYRDACARINAVRQEIGLPVEAETAAVHADVWHLPAGGEIKVEYGYAPTLPDGLILGGMVFRGDRWELVADRETGEVAVLRNNVMQIGLPLQGKGVPVAEVDECRKITAVLAPYQWDGEGLLETLARLLAERGAAMHIAAEAEAKPARRPQPKRSRGRPRKVVQSPPARRRAQKTRRG